MLSKYCSSALLVLMLFGCGSGGGSGSTSTPTANPPSGGSSSGSSSTPAPTPPANVEAPRLISEPADIWRFPGSVDDEQGGFADCGSERTMLRAPNPTQAQHSLNDQTNGMSTCVMSGSFRNSWEFPNLPDVEFSGRDKLIYLNTDILGDLRINGTRIQVNLVGGNVVRGSVCIAQGSTHISFDGYTPAICD